MSDKISAVIITYNEERNIGECIISIQEVVDEIVVVDSFSNDNTKQICEKLGVKFVQKLWEGYSAAKNWGNSLCKYEYILSIDADERLSEELKKSILERKGNLSGTYTFNRLTNYCGKWIQNSGWYPDKKKRLFPKSEAYWNDNSLHEKLLFHHSQSDTYLKGDLLHYSFYSIESHISKINKYTEIEAQQAFSSGEKVSYFAWIMGSFFKFIKIFILHKGYKDGLHGFLIASFSSYSKFLKYAKLKQIYFQQRQKKNL